MSKTPCGFALTWCWPNGLRCPAAQHRCSSGQASIAVRDADAGRHALSGPQLHKSWPGPCQTLSACLHWLQGDPQDIFNAFFGGANPFGNMGGGGGGGGGRQRVHINMGSSGGGGGQRVNLGDMFGGMGGGGGGMGGMGGGFPGGQPSHLSAWLGASHTSA